MRKKYSDFEQNLNPGEHLINLDDETREEVNEYLVSEKGDELLAAFRESLKSGEIEISDNEIDESSEDEQTPGNYIHFLKLKYLKNLLKIKNL